MKSVTHQANVRWLGATMLALVAAVACTARPSVSAASGTQPASSTPATNALKKTDLTYADRVAWRSQLQWPQDCESSFDYPDKSFAGIAFFELSTQHYLVQVTCTLGAYQGTYVFLALDESHSPSTSRLLSFVEYEDSGEPGPNRLQKSEAKELTGTPEFDAGKKQLRLINKFRGLGDCGYLATYAFTKDQPDLVQLQAKLDCDGKAVNPHDWKKMNP